MLLSNYVFAKHRRNFLHQTEERPKKIENYSDCIRKEKKIYKIWLEFMEMLQQDYNEEGKKSIVMHKFSLRKTRFFLAFCRNAK